MSIELLEFKIKPTKFCIGQAIIRYHALEMNCDFVFYPKDGKAWIRLPEKWLNKTNKLRYCAWPDKNTSDEFQEIVLKKIFDKHDLSHEKVKQLHKDFAKERALESNKC